MSCNCGTCNTCPYLVKSTDIAISGANLSITIPTTTLRNKQPLCIILAQSIPSGVTADMPVQIVDDTSTLSVVTHCGNFLYADQLACRKVLRTRIATDSLLAQLTSNSCVRCTSHVFTTLPATTTP